MVGQDCLQRTPIHFPKGGHLLFLSCMENGLLPHGQLDSPLWASWQRYAIKHCIARVVNK